MIVGKVIDPGVSLFIKMSEMLAAKDGNYVTQVCMQ